MNPIEHDASRPAPVADRFLTWAFYDRGVCAYVAARLPLEEKNALLAEWIKLGRPYPTCGGV